MPDKNIKNIIFDFGGVIIDIDYQKSIDAFIRLGGSNFDQIYSQAKQNDIFDRLDTGRISPDTFRNELKNYLPTETTTKMIDEAWNAILIGIPEHRIRLLENIRTNYRIFLMSNTNVIHYHEYIKELKNKFGYDNLGCLFEKVYLSFEIGMRKPDKRIFNLILKENNLDAGETLYIDDFEKNLPPVAQSGIHTLLLDNRLDVTDLFENGFLKDRVELF
ncbi:MAG TPA: HAD family phosphatase [Bacteroidales bacterium]|nr:HAD family phosphatase [Bacteroidales bacterium]